MKLRFLSIALLSLIIPIGSKAQTVNNDLPRVRLSPFSPDYVNNRFHSSEGILFKLNNGDLINICRLDPGEFSDHVRNRGRIMKRTSIDSGKTWSVFMPVYNHPDFDDRNIAGISINKDTLFLFFRTLDAVSNSCIALCELISNDGGKTWSDPIDFPAPLTFVFGGNPIQTPGKHFLVPLYSPNELRIYRSNNARAWNSSDYSSIYKNDSICLSEVSFQILRDGIIVGLARNNTGKSNTAWFISSTDDGVSWEIIGSLPLPYPVAKPFLCYDTNNEILFSLLTDRRAIDHQDSKLFLFIHQIKTENQKPRVETQFLDSLNRPMPNPYRFYGYPTGIEIGKSNYYFLISESNLRNNGLENADLYHFEIQITR